LIKISKGQDETSDDNGPQNYIDDAVLIDKTEVDILNDEINKHYTIKVQCFFKLEIEYGQSNGQSTK
jgi:hypothetical protein